MQRASRRAVGNGAESAFSYSSRRRPFRITFPITFSPLKAVVGTPKAGFSRESGQITSAGMSHPDENSRIDKDWCGKFSHDEVR
jgi:hypothetical protein